MWGVNMKIEYFLNNDVIITNDDILKINKILLEVYPDYNGDIIQDKIPIEFNEEFYFTLSNHLYNLARKPRDEEEFRLIIKCYCWIINVYKNELKEHPDNIDVNYGLANMYPFLSLLLFCDEKDFGIQIDPFGENASFYNLEQSNENAIDFLYECLKLDPGNTDANYYLGLYYALKNDNEVSSLKAYDYLMRLVPNIHCGHYIMNYGDYDIDIFNSLANELISKYDRKDESFNILLKGYEIDHDLNYEDSDMSRLNPNIIYNLAIAYFNGWGTRKSVRRFEKLYEELEEVLKAQNISIDEFLEE